MEAWNILFLSLLLFFGSYAWGSIFCQCLEHYGFSNAKVLITKPIRIAIGISLFLVISGWLIAFSIAWTWALLLWHALGVLVAFYLFIKEHNADLSELITLLKRHWTNFLIFIPSTIIALGIVSRTGFNGIDDRPSYIYLAKKIMVTGGLVDPFNNRRVLSYGASTLYQSIFLKISGVQGILAFDYFFAAMCLVYLVVTYLKKSKVNTIIVLGVAAVIIAGTGLGPETNLSPRFITGFLTLAVLMLCKDFCYSNVENNAIPFSIVSGLLLASIFELRPNSVIAPLFVVLGAFIIKRSSFRQVIVTISTFIFAISGWAIALYVSSRTLFYPLILGTTRKNWSNLPATLNPKVIGPQVWHILLFNNELQIFLLLIVILSVGLLNKAGDSENIAFLTVLVLSGLIQVVVSAYYSNGFDPWMISRYSSPTTFAIGFVAVLIMFEKSLKAKNFLNQSGPKLSWNTIENSYRSVLALIAVVIVCMGYQAQFNLLISKPLLSFEAKSVTHDIFIDAKLGASFLLSGNGNCTPNQIWYLICKNDLISRNDFQELERVNRYIDKNSNVLSAIDNPYLLDMSRFNVSTIDWPSANSIYPGLNLNWTPKQFVNYLKNIGYKYVLTVSPNYNTGYPANLYTGTNAHAFDGSSNYNGKANSATLAGWIKLEDSVINSNLMNRKSFGNYNLLILK